MSHSHTNRYNILISCFHPSLFRPRLNSLHGPGINMYNFAFHRLPELLSYLSYLKK